VVWWSMLIARPPFGLTFSWSVLHAIILWQTTLRSVLESSKPAVMAVCRDDQMRHRVQSITKLIPIFHNGNISDEMRHRVQYLTKSSYFMKTSTWQVKCVNWSCEYTAAAWVNPITTYSLVWVYLTWGVNTPFYSFILFVLYSIK
jgi:hypothetical protein